MSRSKEVGLSLRFKFGPQTIFTFVAPDKKFADITVELLDILRDRFPDGLAVAVPSPDRPTPERIPIPGEGDEYKVAYAQLRNPKEPTMGWRNLHITGPETPAGIKAKNNMVLAFVIQTGDDIGTDPEFVVQIPDPEEEDQ